MIGTDALGSRWPKIIRVLPKPRARAASAYSIFLRLRNEARTTRAIASQPVRPRTMISELTLRPNNVAIDTARMM